MHGFYYFLVDAPAEADAAAVGRAASLALEAYWVEQCDGNNWTTVLDLALRDGRRLVGRGVLEEDWGRKGDVVRERGRWILQGARAASAGWQPGSMRPWREAGEDDEVPGWDAMMVEATLATLSELPALDGDSSDVGTSTAAQTSPAGTYAALCARLAVEGPARVAAVEAEQRTTGTAPRARESGGLLTRATWDALFDLDDATKRHASEWQRILLADFVARFAAAAMPPFSVPCPPELYRAFDLRAVPAADVAGAGILRCDIHT